MNEDKTYNSLPTGALVLIFLGIVFLLINFNVLPWSIWNYLLRLWPLLLVFVGLQAVFGNSRIGNTIIFIIVLGVLIYILLGITGNIDKLPIKLPFSTPVPTSKPFRMYRFDY